MYGVWDRVLGRMYGVWDQGVWEENVWFLEQGAGENVWCLGPGCLGGKMYGVWDRVLGRIYGVWQQGAGENVCSYRILVRGNGVNSQLDRPRCR